MPFPSFYTPEYNPKTGMFEYVVMGTDTSGNISYAFEDAYRSMVGLQNRILGRETFTKKKEDDMLPEGFSFKWSMHGVVLDCRRTDFVPGGGICTFEGIPLEELELQRAVELCRQHVKDKHLG